MGLGFGSVSAVIFFIFRRKKELENASEICMYTHRILSKITNGPFQELNRQASYPHVT